MDEGWTELDWPCPECGGLLIACSHCGEVSCVEDCGWNEPPPDEDEPWDLSPEGFRLHYWRPPGVPAAPHSYGPAIGVRPAELGPLGKELLGG